MTTPDEFRALLESVEGSRVEFKAASGGYNFEDLVKYCVALTNEGGGKIVLGMTDQRPRQVVGSQAFTEPGRTEAGLYEQLQQRIPVREYHHEGKRVLIVRVPARLPGTAWHYKGAFSCEPAMHWSRCPTGSFAGSMRRRGPTSQPRSAQGLVWKISILRLSKFCGDSGSAKPPAKTL